MKPYIALFTLVFLIIILLSFAVFTLIEADPPGSLGAAQMLLAAFITGLLFVQNKARLPTREERRYLLRGSFAVTVLIPALIIAGFLTYLAISFGIEDLKLGLAETIPKLPVGLWTVGLLIVLGTGYLSLWFGYGFLTERIGKQMLKRKGIP
ncbi:ABZJ_00895 family protein [Pseudomethylobacillus aquaticus]|nr:ABZJ_00895 family protein [Pseudomethylobacillus aquaticus]